MNRQVQGNSLSELIIPGSFGRVRSVSFPNQATAEIPPFPLVIAFDAHVLEWTLDNNPPDEFARHHIKEASFYGTDTWTVSMTIKYPSVRDEESATTGMDSALKIEFVGIQEKRMWPAKKAESDGSQAMQLFQAFDAWIDEKTGGTVDALLLGCVRGETVV